MIIKFVCFLGFYASIAQKIDYYQLFDNITRKSIPNSRCISKYLQVQSELSALNIMKTDYKSKYVINSPSNNNNSDYFQNEKPKLIKQHEKFNEAVQNFFNIKESNCANGNSISGYLNNFLMIQHGISEHYMDQNSKSILNAIRNEKKYDIYDKVKNKDEILILLIQIQYMDQVLSKIEEFFNQIDKLSLLKNKKKLKWLKENYAIYPNELIKMMNSDDKSKQKELKILKSIQRWLENIDESNYLVYNFYQDLLLFSFNKFTNDLGILHAWAYNIIQAEKLAFVATNVFDNIVEKTFELYLKIFKNEFNYAKATSISEFNPELLTFDLLNHYFTCMPTSEQDTKNKAFFHIPQMKLLEFLNSAQKQNKPKYSTYTHFFESFDKFLLSEQADRQKSSLKDNHFLLDANNIKKYHFGICEDEIDLHNQIPIFNEFFGYIKQSLKATLYPAMIDDTCQFLIMNQQNLDDLKSLINFKPQKNFDFAPTNQIINSGIRNSFANFHTAYYAVSSKCNDKTISNKLKFTSDVRHFAQLLDHDILLILFAQTSGKTMLNIYNSNMLKALPQIICEMLDKNSAKTYLFCSTEYFADYSYSRFESCGSYDKSKIKFYDGCDARQSI